MSKIRYRMVSVPRIDGSSKGIASGLVSVGICPSNISVQQLVWTTHEIINASVVLIASVTLHSQHLFIPVQYWIHLLDGELVLWSTRGESCRIDAPTATLILEAIVSKFTQEEIRRLEAVSNHAWYTAASYRDSVIESLKREDGDVWVTVPLATLSAPIPTSGIEFGDIE